MTDLSDEELKCMGWSAEQIAFINELQSRLKEAEEVIEKIRELEDIELFVKSLNKLSGLVLRARAYQAKYKDER